MQTMNKGFTMNGVQTFGELTNLCYLVNQERAAKCIKNIKNT